MDYLITNNSEITGIVQTQNGWFEEGQVIRYMPNSYGDGYKGTVVKKSIVGGLCQYTLQRANGEIFAMNHDGNFEECE